MQIAINDVALRTPQRRWADLKAGELVLQDAAGRALAHGRLVAPYAVVEFTDAAAGDCARFERQAPYDGAARAGWQTCFERLSRWQAGWAGVVVSAFVVAGPCRIDRVPVHVRHNADWWLWWVPLPHIGGTPYASYTFEFFIDSTACVAVSPGP
ncbi:MAG: hypothetical protein ABIQ29_02870 [Burkholderiaceae bacterium]